MTINDSQTQSAEAFAFYRDRRVFVSGGAGVIGRELVQRLSKAGAAVFVGDLEPRPGMFGADIRYRRGNLITLRREEIEPFAPEVFIHLAATFERSTETPEFWGENDEHNVRLSHHLMTVLKDVPSLRRAVFASSYLIYDPAQYCFEDPRSEPCALSEESEIRPRNLCGAAKLLHEIELRFLSEMSREHQSEEFSAVSARIFRVYGRYSRDIISRWIRALLNGETLKLFRTDGLFDYVFAGDVAEGLLRLGASQASGVVNLGRGRARKVAEVLEVLRSQFPDMRAEDVESDIPWEASQANMSKFAEVTGWQPTTDLEDAIPGLVNDERLALEQPGLVPLQTRNAEPFRPRHVLLTSLSSKVPLVWAVREAFTHFGTRGRVTGADVDDQVPGRHFTDAFWTMPRLSELTTAALIAYCRKEGIDVIVPTRDGELAFFAARKKDLATAGISVMVSSPEAVETCLDKLKFAQVLGSEEHGFPVIPAFSTLEAPELSDVERFVVKDRYGAGARTMGLNLSRQDAAAHAKTLESVIFQPYIEGVEWSIDAYFDRKHVARGVVCRRRATVVNGESKVTIVEPNEKLAELCTRLGEAIGLTGHAVFQVLVSSNGECHVIECNSRVGGASTASFRAGLLSLVWHLAETDVDSSIEDFPFIPTPRELRMVRAPADHVV